MNKHTTPTEPVIDPEFAAFIQKHWADLHRHFEHRQSPHTYAQKVAKRRDRWRDRYEAKAAELTQALGIASNAYGTASWAQSTKQDVKDDLLPLLRKHWGENYESRLEERISWQRRELARLNAKVAELKEHLQEAELTALHFSGEAFDQGHPGGQAMIEHRDFCKWLNRHGKGWNNKGWGIPSYCRERGYRAGWFQNDE